MVGEVRRGDRGLLTVDDEPVAVRRCLGSYAAQVGSRAGLGQGDRLEVPTAQVPEYFLLLLLVAMAQVGLRGGQSGAIRMDRRQRPRGLLQEDALLDHSRAATAGFDG